MIHITKRMADKITGSLLSVLACIRFEAQKTLDDWPSLVSCRYPQVQLDLLSSANLSNFLTIEYCKNRMLLPPLQNVLCVEYCRTYSCIYLHYEYDYNKYYGLFSKHVCSFDFSIIFHQFITIICTGGPSVAQHSRSHRMPFESTRMRWAHAWALPGWNISGSGNDNEIVILCKTDVS